MSHRSLFLVRILLCVRSPKNTPTNSPNRRPPPSTQTINYETSEKVICIAHIFLLLAVPTSIYSLKTPMYLRTKFNTICVMALNFFHQSFKRFSVFFSPFLFYFVLLFSIVFIRIVLSCSH